MISRQNRPAPLSGNKNTIMARPRDLSEGEYQRIGDIVGDSFSDDPVNLWIFGAREGMRHYYAKAAKKLYLPKCFGHIMYNENGGSLWLPAGTDKHIPLVKSMDVAASMIKHCGFKSLLRGIAVDNALAKAKPKTPHYYLFAIGVRQGRQGKGIGGQLMKEGLERADAANMPAYLESSKESNVSFYMRFGFEVMQTIVPKIGCPPLWLMWRESKQSF